MNNAVIAAVSSTLTSPVPEKLFNPASVAIVGASADPAKLSSRPLENLLKVGFRGRIYPINPRGGEISGVKCYASIAELPETPDVALLVVPGAQALQAAEQCAARGVAAAVVASTGFAEAGEEGALLQKRLGDLSRKGLRVVGPNTNGIYAAHSRFSLGYNAAHAEVFEAGPVSVISHSGAVFNVIAERMRAQEVGLSKFIPVGNEADLEMLDFLEFMVDDPQTEVVLLLIEALRDGLRFRTLVERLRAQGKRVAAIKLGRTAAGVASTAAHSSRLAGNMRAYSALLDAAGVGRVSSIEGLVAFAQIATKAKETWQPSADKALGIITASGAGGTLIADTGLDHGFSVAELSVGTRDGLLCHGPNAGAFNPMDVGNFGGSAKSRETLPLISLDANVDMVVAFSHTLQTPARRQAYAEGIVDGARRSGKPHLVLAPGGVLPEEAKILRGGGVPIFSDTAALFEGLEALCLSAKAAPSCHDAQIELDAFRISDDLNLKPGELNEADSMRLLERAGIPTVSRTVCSTLEEVKRAAQELGWPVVLKGVIDGIAHKSDVGLVRLGISGNRELTSEFRGLRTAMKEVAGEAGAHSPVSVQKMMRAEMEVLVGVTSERPLGQFLVAGMGGRYAEQVNDVRLWPIPVTAEQIRSGLRQIAPGRVLGGRRWNDPGALDELVNVLMRLQALVIAIGPSLAAVEVNPLAVSRDGVTAVDALVIVSDSIGERV